VSDPARRRLTPVALAVPTTRIRDAGGNGAALP